MKKVVFVCVENANRSEMAEAFARLHGAGQVEAFSAGSRPSGRVNPRAGAVLAGVGYPQPLHRAQGLDGLPPGEFDAVIGMGCGDEGCARVRARRREEGDIPDPKEMAPEQY